MAKKPIIHTDNIEITYNKGKSNEFKALKGSTVEILAPEYIILFGPSGCGKSTLLYSIFGVLPPSDGKVYVKGDSIYDYAPMEMVYFQRKTMGIMYQQFNLIPSISVLDNVALPLIFANISPGEREVRAQKLLERFGIGHVAHKRPTNLSGGQQQRVSVARSLVNDPEILIADEPVGNLDSISSKQVMDTLETINERDRKTIILVTHDAKHLPYAHRIYYMKDGAVERIVANPEKEQIKRLEPGEAIVTEIEQLARIFPYSSPTDLRVKSVVNYLTQGVSYDQILRLEKLVGDVLEGKLGRESFRQVLGDDPDNDGVGLDKETADNVTFKMFRLDEQSRDILRYRKMKKSGVVITPHHELVKRIEQYVLEEQGLTELTSIQLERVEESIRNRISGIIRKEDFKDQLITSMEGGGSGLSKALTHEITRYLEKLIAQGVPH